VSDKDILNLRINEKGKIEILKKLGSISSEEEIEEIRNKLLQNIEDTTSTSNLIDLMIA